MLYFFFVTAQLFEKREFYGTRKQNGRNARKKIDNIHVTAYDDFNACTGTL